MAGNGRFELSSASSDSSIVGNYPNGQRGNCSGPSLDRPGSFRESSESKMFSTGKGACRGINTSLGDLPPLSQCLTLEQIPICDQKNSKTGELRRALGFSVGNNSEDTTLGASHLKASTLASIDELKRYRASVADTCGKASSRAKRLDEHLHKLNKYCEAVTSKKQQRNDLLSNERSGASGFKIGAQINPSPSEFVSPKVEERPKNVIPNRRVRTSVAETRAEFRGQLRQSLPIKERDMLKDNNANIDNGEEKIRRLPAGGDISDKRVKRKRLIGVVGSRAGDADPEMKIPTLHKPDADPLGSRVGASVGAGSASPALSNVRAPLNKEQEKPVLSRDAVSGLNKNRLLPKPSFKLSSREETSVAVPKPKASHRRGNVVSNVPSVSGTLDSWDLPPTKNKTPSINGARKRSLPSGPSSPPIGKWGGQRPQKKSRTRRSNLVSPVSNNDEGQMSSEGRSPPDFGAKLITTGPNGSPLSKSASSGSQIDKVKPEIDYSPARLSESEDSSARESKLKEIGTIISPSIVGTQIINSKSKFLSKEENTDGVRRQGRSGRVTSVSRVSSSPVKDKLDNGTVNNPLHQIKPTSEKNGSKTGRPLKKLSDRKGFSRLGPPSGGSPDWDSEDDREELTSAARMAYNSNLKACSSVFWKKVESVFSSLKSEEKSFLAEQGDLLEGMEQEELDSKLEFPILCSGTDSGQLFDKTIPLYQRVLSALITDDEEFVDEMRQNSLCNSPRETDDHVDLLEFKRESVVGDQVPKNGTTNRFIGCNGHANYSRYPNISDNLCNGELSKGDAEHSGSVSPFDCQYEQMPFEQKLLLELQSVGLYPEMVPELREKDEDEIDQEISQLQKKLHQQTARKKMRLDNLHKVVQGQNTCEGDLEHVAMNKLVELAYKKLLATRGNLAVKLGIPKVSKPVAFAFGRRTLARCRRYEESGVSCFTEPALGDIIYAVPPQIHVEDPSASVSKALTNGSFTVPGERGSLDGSENFGHQTDHAFAKSGPISNRGKRKEVMLDDFAGDSVFRSNLGSSLSGGAKGKRTERDKDKAGRSLVNAKGDRKTKLKHTQEPAQLSTSGNRYVSHPIYTSGELMREVGLPSDSSKDKKEPTNLPLNDVDTVEDLVVESDLVEAPQDLNNWFNFDIDGIQDDHDAVGLEIPMDDLSELMF